ncbi:hypothetical protein [Roseibium litorale]|uniref:Cytochrome C biogenesis protein transmembrane domain-containing protein n=1 Tax=Roseibium litorale TaxID=2803841 RepID=A0ABR9CM26_9HYPH|nr:hypothetical protein [Roseibium litorale]MBD8891906.1 hypothetical protein [Roseibium litorale]
MAFDHASAPTTPHPFTRTLIGLGALATGILLAYIWSYELVDKVVADHVARLVLHEGLATYQISSIGTGLLFAFVSGVAGTLTACNVCVLATAVPLTPQTGGPAPAVRSLLPFIGSLLIVACGYGIVGVLLGANFPQLSSQTLGNMPMRLMQAGFVFVCLGLLLVGWGVAVLRNSGEQAGAWHLTSSNKVQIALGVVVAAFQIGRPFPPFRKMFEDAIARGDALYGAAAFGLQALGNVALVLLLVLLLSSWRNGAILTRIGEHPGTRATLISIGFLIGGAFMVSYWGVRVPAIFLVR